MSIELIKKMTILAFVDDADPIIRKLIKLKCVGFETQKISNDDAIKLNILGGNREGEFAQRLKNIENVLNYIAKYSQRKKSMLAPRITADLNAFETGNDMKKAASAVDETLEIQNELKKLAAKETEYFGQISSLTAWESYKGDLSFIGTEHTSVLFGTLPVLVDPDIILGPESEYNAVLDVINRDERASYVRIISYKPEADNVLKLLASYGFTRVAFNELKTTAALAIKNADKNLVALEGDRIRHDERLRELALCIDEIETYYDYIATQLEIERIKQKITKTSSCACISGWVPTVSEEKVIKALSKYECAYELTEAKEEDNPPVLLKNNKFAANFEWVVAMYSYPQYGTFDPTSIMSIFYFIIFGMMFADVMYGLLMIIACFTVIKLKKPAEGTKRFLAMFGLCGISCMIMGVLFGSYFGDLPQSIVTNWLHLDVDLNLALVLDPMQDPMSFLILSIAVGGLHLITGMAIKFYTLCKNGDVFSAIFDVGSWWVIFAGIGLYFIVGVYGALVAIVGVLMILCTNGRSKKGFFGKLIGGLGGLYGIINYMSDLLSYSRILALGLSSAVVAQVVNMLSTMSGVTIKGIILFVIVFPLGHVINIALNVLGAFVHTARLQYVEFFNKFYIDGGTEFKPSAPSEKYTTDEGISVATANESEIQKATI